MKPKLIKIGIVLAILFLLAIGLYAFRTPLANQVKSMRADSLLSKAEKALEEKDIREASQAATAAWQLQTGEIGFLRELLPTARKLNMAELPEMTLLVFLHPDSEEEDQIEILEWTVSRGDAPFFHQLNNSLPKETRQSPPVKLLLATALAKERRTIEAIEVARSLESDPEVGTEATLLLTAILPRLDQNPLAWAQARERSAQPLQNEDPEISLSAWRHLRLLPLAHRDPGPSLDPLQWISSRDDVNAADRFLASQLELYRLPEEERERGIDVVTREYARQSEAVPLLVRWFLEERMAEKLLRVPEQEMNKTAELFTSRLQVLIELGRFEEADKWLEQAPDKVPRVVRDSVQAALANRLGRRSEAVSLWQRSIDRAVSLQQYGDCIAILQIAERFGEKEIAIQMANEIASLPVGSLPQGAVLEYLENYFVDRPEEWLAFWESYTRNRPGDGFATEQVAFLKLFLDEGVDPNEATEKLRQFQEAFPQIIRFRSTIALWMLKAGQSEEAVNYLKGAVTDWNEAPDADRAVLALALWRADLRQEGSALEKSINWGLVTPIRRNYLANLPKISP
ncbi:MAG: hypothetical protein AAF733_09725 [Verrucomicrobiota bacterium]